MSPRRSGSTSCAPADLGTAGLPADWGRLAWAAFASAHEAAGMSSKPAPPVVVEALAAAAVTAHAMTCAATAPALQPADLLVRHSLTLRAPGLMLDALAGLVAAMPVWATRAAALLEAVGAMLTPSAQLVAEVAGLRPAALADRWVARAREVAAAAGTRPADVRDSVLGACDALSAGLRTEWNGAPDVLEGGLPILLRPVADLLLATAMLSDPRCDDVIIRRFAYRRLRSAAAEGLTTRHLSRSEAIVTTAAGWMP